MGSLGSISFSSCFFILAINIYLIKNNSPPPPPEGLLQKPSPSRPSQYLPSTNAWGGNGRLFTLLSANACKALPGFQHHHAHECVCFLLLSAQKVELVAWGPLYGQAGFYARTSRWHNHSSHDFHQTLCPWGFKHSRSNCLDIKLIIY